MSKSAMLPQLHGVVVLNKPKGSSSNHCLMQLKRLGQKKIGHAGTLDPLAQGVLLVLLGQATKLSNYLLQGGSKIYLGTLRLGMVTDTWDLDGKVLEEKESEPFSEEALRKEIESWTNLTEQIIPPFSAAKKDGKPFYKFAREGTLIERTKEVKIFQAQLLDYQHPRLKFRVECSSGTYVRSLAHSLGKRLGCGAVLTELVREYSYPFSLKSAVNLADIEDDPAVLLKGLHPIKDALPDWPCFNVSELWAQSVRQGQPLPEMALPKVKPGQDRALLMYEDCELALVKLTHDDLGTSWKVTRGLWNDANF